ncbi:Rv2732c family membrane protein [Corynebacterium kozikiae]|uniref:Rv2732c family membrane protein n=1 Tax=Corynebacterium kozikiae TaxID=2968469 RepID=UPI00211C4DD8|nr:hypothetical protein [Corynebacterium sp. 76QC2CO]MCQ9342444.1 hypothetical protein [Corynebacterium sp. 76QC2CO]
MDNMDSSDALRRAEQRAGATLALGGVRIALAVIWLVFVLSLLLPHSGSVASWQVLGFQPAAQEVLIKIPEIVFLLLATAAVGVFGGLVALTQRTVLANVAFLLTGMALFSSLLGLWMRLQSAEVQGTPGIGAALYVQVAMVIAQLVCLSLVVFARSPEQLNAQRIRLEAARKLDTVGLAQQEASSEAIAMQEENPLLIDDRRARAKLRHQDGTA